MSQNCTQIQAFSTFLPLFVSSHKAAKVQVQICPQRLQTAQKPDSVSRIIILLLLEVDIIVPCWHHYTPRMSFQYGVLIFFPIFYVIKKTTTLVSHE